MQQRENLQERVGSSWCPATAALTPGQPVAGTCVVSPRCLGQAPTQVCAGAHGHSPKLLVAI